MSNTSIQTCAHRRHMSFFTLLAIIIVEIGYFYHFEFVSLTAPLETQAPLDQSNESHNIIDNEHDINDVIANLTKLTTMLLDNNNVQ